MPHLLDFTKNMCDTCTMDISYCPADSTDVDYGTGSGADNIVNCPFYEANPLLSGEAEVIEDRPKAHA